MRHVCGTVPIAVVSVRAQRPKLDRRINVKRNPANDAISYDNETAIEPGAENFKDQPVVLVLTQYIPGAWTMSDPLAKAVGESVAFRLLDPGADDAVELDRFDCVAVHHPVKGAEEQSADVGPH